MPDGTGTDAAMRAAIEAHVSARVSAEKARIHRDPLFGYASADDPSFRRLREVAAADHVMPDELLPGARSVIAFFLPFTRQVVRSNKRGETASRDWALAYDTTNKLIASVIGETVETLETQGVRAAWLPPTYVFDRKRLVARWSHKHVAWICGMGTFGRNHLLITGEGCSGRFGTFVTDAVLQPSPRPADVHGCRECGYCERVCPVGALRAGSTFDRQACFAQCGRNAERYADIGDVEVCGKCATGPCASRGGRS